MVGDGEPIEANIAEKIDKNVDLEMEDDDSDDDNDSVGSSVNEMGIVKRERALKKRQDCRALASLICDIEVPPPVSFVEFINTVNPKFQAKSDKVEADCLDVYREGKARIKKVLRNLDGKISLSADIVWNAQRYDGIIDRYLCLRAHFIDDNWKLKNWVLSYHPVWQDNDDDTYDFPETVILKVLEELDIGDKISTLTMTGGDLFSETANSVEEYINKKKVLQLNGKFSRVCCLGDVISLMAQDAFGAIEETFDKLYELCGSSKHAPLWSMRNFALDNALKMEAMGEFSSKTVTDFYDVPSVDEWNKVRSIHTLVDRIYKVATMLFSETKHLTANVYLYHLVEIQAILIEESTSSDSFIKTVASEMLLRFNKYMKDMNWVLTIATFMDPRFKIKSVEFTSSKFVGDDGNLQATSVLETIRSLYDEYDAQTPKKDNFVSDSSSSDSEGDSWFKKKQPQNFLDDFSVLKEYNQSVQSTPQPQKSDLDLYLEEPVISWSKEFNALIWWKHASSKYPILSRMARDFLAIPMSLAASSDAFFATEREADPRITSLKKADLMNALACTRSWYEKS